MGSDDTLRTCGGSGSPPRSRMSSRDPSAGGHAEQSILAASIRNIESGERRTLDPLGRNAPFVSGAPSGYRLDSLAFD